MCLLEWIFIEAYDVSGTILDAKSIAENKAESPAIMQFTF